MDHDAEAFAAAAAAAAVGTWRATSSRTLAAAAAQHTWALYQPVQARQPQRFAFEEQDAHTEMGEAESVEIPYFEEITTLAEKLDAALPWGGYLSMIVEKLDVDRDCNIPPVEYDADVALHNEDGDGYITHAEPDTGFTVPDPDLATEGFLDGAEKYIEAHDSARLSAGELAAGQESNGDKYDMLDADKDGRNMSAEYNVGLDFIDTNKVGFISSAEFVAESGSGTLRPPHLPRPPEPPGSQDLQATKDALGCVEEEIVELPQCEKNTDPFFGFRISRDTNGVTFNGKVADILMGAESLDRLYYILYDDGDREHLTAVEVATAAKNAE